MVVLPAPHSASPPTLPLDGFRALVNSTVRALCSVVECPKTRDEYLLPLALYETLKNTVSALDRLEIYTNFPGNNGLLADSQNSRGHDHVAPAPGLALRYERAIEISKVANISVALSFLYTFPA